MWSRTAPLFRSWLVKMSLGNSCIAEERESERGNVTVTTHQQRDREVTCPRHTPTSPGCRRFRRLALNLFVCGTYGRVICSPLVPPSFFTLFFFITGLSNTAKMCCIPRNGAPQPEGVKCKLKNSLWSSSNKEKKNTELENSDNIKSFEFSKGMKRL